MTFASIEFLVFFTIVFGLLVIIQHLRLSERYIDRACHIVLLIASYIFYGWWDWRFCFLLLGLTVVSYITALFKNKVSFIISVVTPLTILAVFKYANFFIDSFCELFSINNSSAINIILPVGISFYIFQALSYNIDVYKGKIDKEKDFIRYALFISFFPQLVAGPIVKASEFLPQLYESRRVRLGGIHNGIQIFLFGMFKKLVIADNLSVFVDEIFAAPKAFNSCTVWLAVISYSIQIYMDFSGYSDMAIGCAKCLGYDLPRNFNLPYISRNVTEFWKRWHISLSGWLMQYLYIPLGGNRKGTVRTYINLIVTMALGGLWHGADWTFVIWGLAHGIALCIHKVFMKLTKKKNRTHGKTAAVLISAVSILGTYIFVIMCWVLFRAADFTNAKDVLYRMIIPSSGLTHIYSWSIFSIIILIAATAVAYLKNKKQATDAGKTVRTEGFYPVLNLKKFWNIVILFVVAGLILGMAYVNSNPFIYFQF